MRYVGIDPGTKGAVAVISENGISVYDMPQEDKDIQALMRSIELDSHIMIEMSWPRPVQGVISAFKMGRDFGYMRGLLCKADVVEVSPQRWKKALWPDRKWVPIPKGTDSKIRKQMLLERREQSKADSLALALKLYPAISKELERKKDEGRAEAILIAHYGLSLRKV